MSRSFSPRSIPTCPVIFSQVPPYGPGVCQIFLPDTCTSLRTLNPNPTRLEFFFSLFSQIPPERRPPNLTKPQPMMASLLDTSCWADFHIVCGETRLPVHRCVLYAYVPYFRGLFGPPAGLSGRGKTTEGGPFAETSEVHFPDIPFSLMQIWIRYVYTFDAGVIDSIATAEGLMRLADRFCQAVLLRDCEQYLFDILSPPNCGSILELSRTCNAFPLLEIATELSLRLLPEKLSANTTGVWWLRGHAMLAREEDHGGRSYAYPRASFAPPTTAEREGECAAPEHRGNPSCPSESPPHPSPPSASPPRQDPSPSREGAPALATPSPPGAATSNGGGAVLVQNAWLDTALQEQSCFRPEATGKHLKLGAGGGGLSGRGSFPQYLLPAAINPKRCEDRDRIRVVEDECQVRSRIYISGTPFLASLGSWSVLHVRII